MRDIRLVCDKIRTAVKNLGIVHCMPTGDECSRLIASEGRFHMYLGRNWCRSWNNWLE